MPLFAHSVHHPTLDGSPAGATDRHAQLIMTRQTIELALEFPRISAELFTAHTHTRTQSGFYTLLDIMMSILYTKLSAFLHFLINMIYFHL